MIKKTFNLFFFLFLFFINSCGFKPVLVGSDYDFSIQIDRTNGNDEINSMIENKIKMLDGINKKFKLILNSKETKNILSKDSKGDPAILELILDLNYILTENGKELVNKNLTQKSTYNNISDKFELSKSEETLKNNLVENLTADIINTASNLMLNPMANDN